MKKGNWMDWLRRCLRANLSIWVDEEANPMIQDWFVQNYAALREKYLDSSQMTAEASR